jgi:hypothetical protein
MSVASEEADVVPPLTPSGKSRVVVKMRVRRPSSTRTTPRGRVSGGDDDELVEVSSSIANEPPLVRSRVEASVVVSPHDDDEHAERRSSLAESLPESDSPSVSESASLDSDVDDIDRTAARRFVQSAIERALAVEFVNKVVQRALATLSAVH